MIIVSSRPAGWLNSDGLTSSDGSLLFSQLPVPHRLPLQFRLTPFEPIKARSKTVLQRWGMKGPIRACWKYSACSSYLAWPIIPSAALLTSPSPLGRSAPLCAVIDMWITMCGDSNKSASWAGYPASSQSQLALPERRPLPPSEEANKNDKLTVKELHIFHMLSWKLLRFCQGFFFLSSLFSYIFTHLSLRPHPDIWNPSFIKAI